MKFIIKYIFLPIFLIVTFNFLEYGLTWDRIDQFIYPIILTAISLVNFLKPKLRKLFLVFSLAILGLMVLIYLLDEIALANIIGSFGFSLFTIVIIAYLPSLFKTGYIKNL